MQDNFDVLAELHFVFETAVSQRCASPQGGGTSASGTVRVAGGSGGDRRREGDSYDEVSRWDWEHPSI